MSFIDSCIYRSELVKKEKRLKSDVVTKAKNLLFHHLNSMKIFTVKPEQVYVIHADFTEDGFDVLFGIKKQYFDNELYEVCYTDDKVNRIVTYTMQIYRSMYEKTSEIALDLLKETSD